MKAGNCIRITYNQINSTIAVVDTCKKDTVWVGGIPFRGNFVFEVDPCISIAGRVGSDYRTYDTTITTHDTLIVAGDTIVAKPDTLIEETFHDVPDTLKWTNTCPGAIGDDSLRFSPAQKDIALNKVDSITINGIKKASFTFVFIGDDDSVRFSPLQKNIALNKIDSITINGIKKAVFTFTLIGDDDSVRFSPAQKDIALNKIDSIWINGRKLKNVTIAQGSNITIAITNDTLITISSTGGDTTAYHKIWQSNVSWSPSNIWNGATTFNGTAQFIKEPSAAFDAVNKKYSDTSSVSQIETTLGIADTNLVYNDAYWGKLCAGSFFILGYAVHIEDSQFRYVDFWRRIDSAGVMKPDSINYGEVFRLRYCPYHVNDSGYASAYNNPSHLRRIILQKAAAGAYNDQFYTIATLNLNNVSLLQGGSYDINWVWYRVALKGKRKW